MPELNITSCDWNAYITLLRQQDALWARHRDNISLSSYLRCLEDARAVLSLPSWDELSHREATILLGLGMQYGPHGLLGSLRGAGIVKATFMQDIPEYRHIRIRIRDAILAAREAETIMDFIRCAQTAVDTIVRLPRFSMATATRLLTLARPDRAVSINGASKAGLARLTGRTQYWISEPRNYGMLLRWVYAQLSVACACGCGRGRLVAGPCGLARCPCLRQQQPADTGLSHAHPGGLNGKKHGSVCPSFSCPAVCGLF